MMVGVLRVTTHPFRKRRPRSLAATAANPTINPAAVARHAGREPPARAELAMLTVAPTVVRARWGAAQAEGERCSRMPEDELRALVDEDTHFDGDDTNECPRQ